MRKALGLIIAMVFLLSFLPACSPTQDPNTLRIGLHQAGYGKEWLEKISAKFEEENEGITVEIVGDPGMTDTIGYKLESNTEVMDIFFGLEVVLVKGWAVRGWVEPLDDLYGMQDSNGIKIKDKIIDGYSNFSRVTSRFGTHDYAMPWNDGATGIYYNTNMFKDYDIRIPTVVTNPNCITNTRSTFGSKSWASDQEIGLLEVNTYIKSLNVNDDTNTKNDIAPYAWGGTISAYWDYIVKSWWVQQIGVEAYKDFMLMKSVEQFDNTKSPMKELQIAMEVVDAMIFDTPSNSVKDSASKDHITSQMDFMASRSAMMVNGPWLEYEMKNNKPDGFEMKLMENPFINGALTDDNGERIAINNTLASDYAFIPSAAKNKDLAKKFLAFTANDDMLQLYLDTAGTVRPFKHTPDTSKLSVCQKSIVDIWQNSVNFYHVSETNFSVIQRANTYVSGNPYPSLSANARTAQKFMEDNYSFAKQEWSKWLIEAGM